MSAVLDGIRGRHTAAPAPAADAAAELLTLRSLHPGAQLPDDADRIARLERKLKRERHDLMLAALDERAWDFRRRWRRRSRIRRIDDALGRGLPW